ncbi:MAG: 4-(cytidine 5'-diphospho)-2-C-methyl-D-erythritol kinase [Betaproteobacteria bacterium]|nr:4-(cytidine 5'-diphospho)-2-C-methyl-D-erythritol kinase [Betaproteobacteria bacterium]
MSVTTTRELPWGQVFPAPAKVNLFLHVTGRRADGYHLLQTAFRLVDLQDSLRFFPGRAGDFRLVTPLPGVREEDDLCVRAARALQGASRHSLGVHIALEKRIPIGGGLGGGSSDAATTLLALNHLWGLGLGRRELMAIGLRLGADVPFFLLGANAFAEGIGEALTPVELAPAWYLILVPPVAVPTAAVFAAPELTRNSKTITISSFSDSLLAPQGDADRGSAECVRRPVLFGRNDLEAVVCHKYPEVAGHLEWLKANSGPAGTTARMSGSGACVFAQFATEAGACAVARRLPQGMRGIVARGLERHPILAMLEE